MLSSFKDFIYSIGKRPVYVIPACIEQAVPVSMATLIKLHEIRAIDRVSFIANEHEIVIIQVHYV